MSPKVAKHDPGAKILCPNRKPATANFSDEVDELDAKKRFCRQQKSDEQYW